MADKDTQAKAIVHAAIHTDQEAADKHDVHRSTIYRWREKLGQDTELQRLTSKYWQQVRASESWVQDATHTIRSAQSFIRRAADEMDATDPKAVEAMTEALQTLTESLQMARIVDARLGTSRQHDPQDGQDDAGRLPE